MGNGLYKGIMEIWHVAEEVWSTANDIDCVLTACSRQMKRR